MLKNLIGNKYGTLTVIGRAENKRRSGSRWVCKCECGEIKEVDGYYLRKGRIRSCGKKECRPKYERLNKRTDIIGQRFDRLTAIECIGNVDGKVLWKCRCDCGNETTATASQLKTGKKTSCGCKKYEIGAVDHTDKRYGRLLVLERAEHSDKGWLWKCQCDCGNICKVRSGLLASGLTKSCGCLADDNRKIGYNRKHGDALPNAKHHRIYNEWSLMVRRCRPNSQNHDRYYDRGIRVCAEWENDYLTFKEWALKNGYSDELSIDRIDNDGNYEPMNCRWADKITQANNTSTNVFITYKGKTQTMAQWSRETGIKYRVLFDRYHRGLKDDALFKTTGR